MGLYGKKKTELLTHTPTVVVVQGRTNEYRLKGEQATFQQLAEQAGVKLKFLNPLKDGQDTYQPWENPEKLLEGADGILFAGSSDVDLTKRTTERDLYVARVEEVAKKALQKGRRLIRPMPVLGICLGHQMLHFTARGGEKKERRRSEERKTIQRDLQKMETGTSRVTLTRRGAKDPLFVHVPMTRGEEGKWGFNTIFGHKDSVARKVWWFERRGSSGKDPNAITRSWVGDIVTFQPHPEVTDATELRNILKQVNGQVKVLGSYDENYPLEDTPGTDMIVVNFFKRVTARAQKRKARTI